MRKLRYHESKLLRKTNFLKYDDKTSIEHKLISMYQIEQREDIYKYKKIVQMVRQISESLVCHRRESNNEKRDFCNKVDLYIKHLTNKLYSHGLIQDRQLISAYKLRINDFCERRITTLLKRLNFANSIEEAVKLVKQGHINVGNKRINSIDVIVSKNMENFINWHENSKHKKCIDNFNSNLDEY